MYSCLFLSIPACYHLFLYAWISDGYQQCISLCLNFQYERWISLRFNFLYEIWISLSLNFPNEIWIYFLLNFLSEIRIFEFLIWYLNFFMLEFSTGYLTLNCILWISSDSDFSGLRTSAASLTSLQPNGLYSLKSPISLKNFVVLMVGLSLAPKWLILFPSCWMNHQKTKIF